MKYIVSSIIVMLAIAGGTAQAQEVIGVHHPDCAGLVKDIEPGATTPIDGIVWVKAGPNHYNVGYHDAGYVAGPQGGHAVSHVDVCPETPDTTTTTTTTTQPEVTTTTTEPVETTTTDPGTTTTTEPDEVTTTTTEPATATTQPDTTTTTVEQCCAPVPTTTTIVASTITRELPKTGLSATAGMLAGVLLLVGVGLVLGARRPA